jgi:hypothetical protein
MLASFLTGAAVTAACFLCCGQSPLAISIRQEIAGSSAPTLGVSAAPQVGRATSPSTVPMVISEATGSERLARLNPLKYESMNARGEITEELAQALDLNDAERAKVNECFDKFKSVTLAAQATHMEKLEATEVVQRYHISPFLEDYKLAQTQLLSKVRAALPMSKAEFIATNISERLSAPFLISSGGAHVGLEFKALDGGDIRFTQRNYDITPTGQEQLRANHSTQFKDLPENLALIFNVR